MNDRRMQLELRELVTKASREKDAEIGRLKLIITQAVEAIDEGEHNEAHDILLGAFND